MTERAGTNICQMVSQPSDLKICRVGTVNDKRFNYHSWGKPGNVRFSKSHFESKAGIKEVNVISGKLLLSLKFVCLRCLYISFSGGEISVGGWRFNTGGGVGDPGGRLSHPHRLHRPPHPGPHHCHRHRLPPPRVPAVRNPGLLATRPGLFIEIYLWYRLKLGLNVLEVRWPWGKGVVPPVSINFLGIWSSVKGRVS